MITNIPIHTNIHTRTPTCTHTNTLLHTYTHTHTNRQTHTYIHAHKHSSGRVTASYNVFCIDSGKLWDTPFDAMVRLVDGQFVTEGRVEIYCNEKWGTVCETSDHTDFANVICQQLGYTNVVDWDDLPM